MRVAFFTAGTMGAGHLVHGRAIGRALRRAGFTGTYRMFGPPQLFPLASPANAARYDADGAGHGRAATWEDVRVVDDELLSPEAAPESDVARRLVAFAPDLLLVDMFWAPLRWVLPSLACERWLLLRSFPPLWLVGPPRAPFEPSQYERILAIEPVTAKVVTHAVDPVVVANPDECKPRGALRERLGVRRDEELIAVMHAGLKGELAQLVPAASKPKQRVVRFDMFDEDALFPVAEWLGDCDHVHASPGYNAFWEAHWLGYAGRTTFTSFLRRNDDPRWRMDRCAGYVMKKNGADTLARWITT